jgi:hypothetical protein
MWTCRLLTFEVIFLMNSLFYIKIIFQRFFLARVSQLLNLGHYLTQVASSLSDLFRLFSQVSLPFWKSVSRSWHWKSWCCTWRTLTSVGYSLSGTQIGWFFSSHRRSSSTLISSLLVSDKLKWKNTFRNIFWAVTES